MAAQLAAEQLAAEQLAGIMLREPVRLVIDDEERPHRPPRLREDAQLLVGQVTDNGDLRVGPGRG